MGKGNLQGVVLAAALAVGTPAVGSSELMGSEVAKPDFCEEVSKDLMSAGFVHYVADNEQEAAARDVANDIFSEEPEWVQESGRKLTSMAFSESYRLFEEDLVDDDSALERAFYRVHTRCLSYKW